MKIVQVFPMLNAYLMCGDGGAQVLLGNPDEEGFLAPENTTKGSVERWLAEMPPMTAGYDSKTKIVGRVDPDRYAVWAEVLAMSGALESDIVAALDAMRDHILRGA